MVSPQLHAHLQYEMQRIVDEMIQAHCTWADIVETLQTLMLNAWWHTQGMFSWWLS
ncbi:hypothetical protein JZ785_27485 (plasmid) [Alicyclobacillus curvatus]|nr:hypothetical protein JZ785_27485 [Alicyclobacillus curvatus]